MQLSEYRELTKRTLPNLGTILKDTGLEGTEIYDKISNKLNYSHMALGLGSEIGELVECVGTELKLKIDKVNLGEEIGDLYWYLANFANMRNIPLPEDNVQIEVPTEMCLDYLITKVGDLIDIVKRYVAYNKEIERAKELEVVYDVRVALLLFERVYELDGNDIRRKNIDKLAKRYPDKFDEYLAINRNIEEERKALES